MADLTIEQLLSVQISRGLPAVVSVGDLPAGPAALLRLFDDALRAGYRQGAPLALIQAPLGRFPGLDHAFWHVPIEDAGEENAVRFCFSAAGLAEAA